MLQNDVYNKIGLLIAQWSPLCYKAVGTILGHAVKRICCLQLSAISKYV
jgi:hypothetical protein